jgi:hypothetical protein
MLKEVQHDGLGIAPASAFARHVTLNSFQGPVIHPRRGASLDAETGSA